MKPLRILFAVLAIAIGATNAFGTGNRFNPPAGYSLFSYITGNPTIATSWSRISPDAFVCMHDYGVPCKIQGHANGTHPLQTDVDQLKAVAGSAMNVRATSASNSNVKLYVEITD